ncbi:hypothetical protein [Paenibacillus sp. AGC30]
MPECDYTQCHAILRETKADTFIMETKHSFKDNFYKWIKNTSYEEYMRNVSNGLGIDVAIPIEGVDTSLGLNSSTTKETYERIQKAIEENTIRNISEEDAKRIVISNTNEQVYKAWSDCMQSMISRCEVDPPSPPGTLQLKKLQRKGNEIYITLQSLVYPGDSEVVVENFYVPSMFSCLTGCFKNGDHIKGEHSIVLERLREGEGNVVIDTSRNTLEIPISVHITSKMANQVRWDLTDFIKKRLQQNGYANPNVRLEITFAGVLVEYQFFIRSHTTNNEEFLEVGSDRAQEYYYSPTPNRPYRMEINTDNGTKLNFSLSAEEICTVIRTSIDANIPSPAN